MKHILYGSGGHAKVILDIARKNEISIDGLLDDAEHLWNTGFYTCRVLGSYEKLKSGLADSSFLISIGNNAIRKRVVNSLNSPSFFSLIDPSAKLSPSVRIGTGSCIMPGVSINADTKIGQHCIINTNSSIDHDCIIEDYVHIAPGVNLCGGVTVGEGSLIGVGACAIPGIKIGKWCTIGAGSVVTKDIPDGATAVGNPAKVLPHS